MRQSFLVLLIVMGAISCNPKKVPLSGTENVNAKDFFAAFKMITLPYKATDTNFMKSADTTTISYSVLSQFIPDSVLSFETEHSVTELKAKPVGQFVKGNVIYLLVDIWQNKKSRLVAFVFDKHNKYLSHLDLLNKGFKEDNYNHNVTITSEPTFIIGRDKINAQNELMYTRTGYAFNDSSGGFITVLTDSNEDRKRLEEIVNPIDTLPVKNKFSGDYAKDKKNFISVRDGKSSSKYLFFIHFEKDNCKGELKGEMTMRDATHAYFHQSGDPCVIDFSFATKSITAKEQGNCGTHRGIQCFFDDTYRKKKDVKNVSRKKSK